MKRLTLITIIIFSVFTVFSQENAEQKTWTKGATGNLTFSQVALSNWAAGGQDSYSTDILVNLFANYRKGKSSWDNTLKLAYGIVKIKDEDMKKSNDQIEFESKYGYQASKHWAYSAMLTFRSQFMEGYDYVSTPRVRISDFMAPGYLTLGFGMDYKPMERLSIFMSPLTGKATFVLDEDLSNAGAFGVKAGEKSLLEYGALVKIKFEQPIVKNINFVTSADFFTSYNNNPGNIDVNWEVLLDMRINKYLSANIRTHLIYDDDIKIADDKGNMAPRIQFKEAFGLGISYKIGD